MKNRNFVTIKRTFALLIMIAALGLSIAAQTRQLGSGGVVEDGGGGLGSGNAVCNGQLGSGNAVCNGQLGSGNRIADGGSLFGGGDFWAWIKSII